jgi:hypothetical protein
VYPDDATCHRRDEHRDTEGSAHAPLRASANDRAFPLVIADQADW